MRSTRPLPWHTKRHSYIFQPCSLRLLCVKINTLIVIYDRRFCSLPKTKKKESAVSRVSAVPSNAGSQFSAVKTSCHDLVVQNTTVLQNIVVVRGPTLERALSSGKAPH